MPPVQKSSGSGAVLAIVIFLILVVVGVAVWYFVIRKNETAEPTSTVITPPTPPPPPPVLSPAPVPVPSTAPAPSPAGFDLSTPMPAAPLGTPQPASSGGGGGGSPQPASGGGGGGSPQPASGGGGGGGSPQPSSGPAFVLNPPATYPGSFTIFGLPPLGIFMDPDTSGDILISFHDNMDDTQNRLFLPAEIVPGTYIRVPIIPTGIFTSTPIVIYIVNIDTSTPGRFRGIILNHQITSFLSVRLPTNPCTIESSSFTDIRGEYFVRNTPTAAPSSSLRFIFECGTHTGTSGTVRFDNSSVSSLLPYSRSTNTTININGTNYTIDFGTYIGRTAPTVVMSPNTGTGASYVKQNSNDLCPAPASNPTPAAQPPNLTGRIYQTLVSSQSTFIYLYFQNANTVKIYFKALSGTSAAPWGTPQLSYTVSFPTSSLLNGNVVWDMTGLLSGTGIQLNSFQVSCLDSNTKYDTSRDDISCGATHIFSRVQSVQGIP